MAIQKPIVIIGGALQQMPATDVAPVGNGSTGKTTSDLTGNTGKVLTVNGTEDGYTFSTNGGGVTAEQAIAYAIALG